MPSLIAGPSVGALIIERFGANRTLAALTAVSAPTLALVTLVWVLFANLSRRRQGVSTPELCEPLPLCFRERFGPIR